MNPLTDSGTKRKRKRIPLKENVDIPLEFLEKLELLVKRNQYLEKEYARMAQRSEQIKEESEQLALKGSALQQLNEMEAKCASLLTRNTELTQRMNEYHRQMQQAKSETIGLRRKLTGVLGHIQHALARDSRPNAKEPELLPSSPFQMLKQENKLLKWKLSVVDGYLGGMFPEEELDQGQL